jgi:hypothetical protein
MHAAPAMGRNDFGNAQYDGPQPPKGHGVHHYRFRLFALDVPELDVPKGASASQVLDAAQEHAIAEAETVGTSNAEWGLAPNGRSVLDLMFGRRSRGGYRGAASALFARLGPIPITSG